MESVIRELLLVCNILRAIYIDTKLCVFCSVLTMIALSRGSAIHTLPQRHSIYSLYVVLRRPYIIDWAHATQGNASADAARTFLKFSLTYGEERANKYLDLFCKKSDTAKQYVQQWMPIVAASQSVKGHEEERDLLLRWVDVFEYQ